MAQRRLLDAASLLSIDYNKGGAGSDPAPLVESAAVSWISDGSGREPSDRDSIMLLYRRYAGWLTARLRQRFGDDMAEELVQETYLRIAPREWVGSIKHPKAFLLKTATNLAIDSYRKGQRSGPALATPYPDAEHAAQDAAVLLRQVVLGLPTPLRDVFVLSRFAHLTYPEIAGRLGLSVKTVEWRMSKALAHCAARLRP